MSATEVAVIDYGMGNLLSVRRGLEHCGAKVTMAADHAAIRSATRLVLPGVGAFGNGMAELRRLGLEEAIHDAAQHGIPLLGICLGMQMLLDESEEFGVTAGLGLIPGRVVGIPSATITGEPHKVPHIGWNALVYPKERADWQNTILGDIKPGDAVYFVHSFMATPSEQSDRVADCIYGGHSISAVIARNNVVGCQFHPEKSGAIGLKILQRFLAL